MPPMHPILEYPGPGQPVSIVITTYNDARFLAEAIESALGQTVSACEVIVVDDGSRDDPVPVVSRYPQVRLIRQCNQGLAAARNTGWRAARGAYVVFLDADDRLMPGALASNLRRFDERPECAFVYGSYSHIDFERLTSEFAAAEINWRRRLQNIARGQLRGNARNGDVPARLFGGGGRLRRTGIELRGLRALLTFGAPVPRGRRRRSCCRVPAPR